MVRRSERCDEILLAPVGVRHTPPLSGVWVIRQTVSVLQYLCSGNSYRT